jgi:hypothetical protein
MGYERHITRASVGMIFAGELPATIPGPPRGLKAGEVMPPSEVIGGTLNHGKLALCSRGLYLLIDGEARRELADATLDALADQLRYELADSWECRGNACEQTSPSHGQWNEAAGWFALYLGLRFSRPLLAAVALAWIRASWAVSAKIFAPPVPWTKPDSRPSPVDGLLVVGARAFSDEAGNPVGGRCLVRDKLFAWFAGGPRPKLGNPLLEIDEAALHVAALIEREYLPDLVKRVTAEPLPVPPLRMPVERWTGMRGSRWFYLGRLGSVHEVQRLAGVDGPASAPRFGFDSATLPTLDPARHQFDVFAGAPITTYPPVLAPGKGDLMPSSTATSLAEVLVQNRRGETRWLGQDARWKTAHIKTQGPYREGLGGEAFEARYGVGSWNRKQSGRGENLVIDWIGDIAEELGLPAGYRVTDQDVDDLRMMPSGYSWLQGRYREITGKEPGVGDSKPVEPKPRPEEPKPEPKPDPPAGPADPKPEPLVDRFRRELTAMRGRIDGLLDLIK